MKKVISENNQPIILGGGLAGLSACFEKYEGCFTIGSFVTP